jgi:hypothetical protein
MPTSAIPLHAVDPSPCSMPVTSDPAYPFAVQRNPATTTARRLLIVDENWW